MAVFNDHSPLRHDEEAPLLESQTTLKTSGNNTEPHVVGGKNIPIVEKEATITSMSTELTGYFLMITTAVVFGTSNIEQWYIPF